MKKSILLVLLAAGLLLCTACATTDTPEDIPADDTVADTIDTYDTTTPDAATISPDASHDHSYNPADYDVTLEEGPRIDTNASSFRVIELPLEGETLTYDPPLLLFAGEDGKDFNVLSIKRENNIFYFDVKDAENVDYYFAGISIAIFTAQKEVFVSMNRVSGAEPYDYRCKKFAMPGVFPTPATMQEDIIAELGDAFDATKNYYRVRDFTYYDKEIADSVQAEREKLWNQ